MPTILWYKAKESEREVLPHEGRLATFLLENSNTSPKITPQPLEIPQPYCSSACYGFCKIVLLYLCVYVVQSEPTNLYRKTGIVCTVPTVRLKYESGTRVKSMSVYLTEHCTKGGDDKSLALWRKQQATGLKKCIYSTYSPPPRSLHVWLRCSYFFNPSKKKIIFLWATNVKIGKPKNYQHP
jgi:hypothetical protein